MRISLLPVKKNASIKFIKSLLTLTACLKKHEPTHLKLLGAEPILSALQTPTYKLQSTKYLVPILEPLTNTQSKNHLTLPLK